MNQLTRLSDGEARDVRNRFDVVKSHAGEIWFAGTSSLQLDCRHRLRELGFTDERDDTSFESRIKGDFGTVAELERHLVCEQRVYSLVPPYLAYRD